MSQNRRRFLKQLIITGTGCLTAVGSLLTPLLARATWSAEHYARTDLKTTWSSLLAGEKPKKTNKITIKMPKIAENGAIVPITIHSDLDQTQVISIIAEKNPVPLIAQFSFAPEMTKQVTARIKLGATGNVIALVRANDHYYMARRYVRVTVGGCGD